MAIIGEIRKRPTLVLVLVGLALLSFVLADAFSNFFGPSVENQKTVLLDGERIGDERFLLLNELENFYKISGESQALNAKREHGLADERSERKQAWDRFALLALIQEQNNEIGLETPEGELQLLFYAGDSTQISEWVINRPFIDYWPIRNNQDRPEFQGYSAEYGRQSMNDPATRYMVSQLRLEKKYTTLLNAGFYATTLEAKRDAQKTSNSKSIQFVYKRYAELPDSAYMPTDEEVKEYYQKHKNDLKYRDTPGRLVEIAQLTMPPTEEDKQTILRAAMSLANSFQNEEHDLNKIIASSETFDPKVQMDEQKPPIVQADTNNIPAQFRDLVFNQDSTGVFGPYEENGYYRLMKIRNRYPRRASHILFGKDGKNANNAQLADSIIKALKADTTGLLFGQLARKYSEDGSSVNGGDLGYFDYKTMVPSFANLVYTLDSGDINGVYSKFGLHIVQVTDIADTGMFKTASFIDKRIMPSATTIKNYRNEARNIGSNVINGDGEFKVVADSMGFNVQELRVDETNTVVPGFANSQVIYDFVMNGVYDDISNPIILEDHIYVLRIKKVYKKGPKDEEDTFDSMKKDLMNEKKANAFKVQIANARGLDDVAMKWGSEVKNDEILFSDSRIDGAGTNDMKVIGALFGNHPEGTMLEPIEGAQGVYAVVIVASKQPETGDITVNQNNLRAQRQNLMYGRNRDSGLLKALQEFIKIEDNR